MDKCRATDDATATLRPGAFNRVPCAMECFCPAHMPIFTAPVLTVCVKKSPRLCTSHMLLTNPSVSCWKNRRNLTRLTAPVGLTAVPFVATKRLATESTFGNRLDGRVVALANDVFVVHEEVGEGGAEGVEVGCHGTGAGECGVVRV